MSRHAVASRLGLASLLPACAVAAAAAADGFRAAAVALAEACSAGKADTCEFATEYPTSFSPLNPELSASGIIQRFLRDGVVMFRFKPELLLPGKQEESFRAVDRLPAAFGLVRQNQGHPNATNVSQNKERDPNGPSPLRLHFFKHAVLAPADDYVQGPHQEGSHHTRGNRRVLAFLCEETGTEGGDTALFDMQRAWELLPADLQELLSQASFGFYKYEKAKDSAPVLLKVPAVVLHEITRKPCLQFYCFGRVRHACVDVYRDLTGHYHVAPDRFQYGIHLDMDLQLIHRNGTMRPFIGLELYRLLSVIYDTMIAHSWSRGDALVIDNIRWAHARLNGKGAERKIHFLTYGPQNRTFDLFKLARPSL